MNIKCISQHQTIVKKLVLKSLLVFLKIRAIYLNSTKIRRTALNSLKCMIFTEIELKRHKKITL